MSKTSGSAKRREKRVAQRKYGNKNQAPKIEVDEKDLTRAVPMQGEQTATSLEEWNQKQQQSKNVEVDVNGVTDLDERRKKLMQGEIVRKETGYKTKVRLVFRESRLNGVIGAVNMVWRKIFGCKPGFDLIRKTWIMKMELHNSFILSNMVTRCMALTWDPKVQRYYLHQVPVYMMGRQTIMHAIKYKWSWGRKYGWYAEMDATTPHKVNFDYGRDVWTKYQEYYLVQEEKRWDALLDKETYPYRLEIVD